MNKNKISHNKQEIHIMTAINIKQIMLSIKND